MIHRIKQCERDIINLKDLIKRPGAVHSPQPEDYLNRVVLKPWGYEFLMYQNDSVAAWFLHIKKGHSTSMHCHPLKKTSLLMLSGDAISRTLDGRYLVSDFQGVVIEKGVFHSTESLSSEGIDLIEVETPPNKTDLVRLQDVYGRQASGYEGLSEMRNSNLEKFRYFYLNGPNPVSLTSGSGARYGISLQLVKDIKVSPEAIYCICSGTRSVGDSLMGKHLLELGMHELEPSTRLLVVEPIGQGYH